MSNADLISMNDIMFTAVNHRDWDNVLRYIGDDTDIHVGTLGNLRGTTGADAVIAFFDRHFDYRFLKWENVVEGDQSGALATVRLTYLETIYGLPAATGQVADVPVVVFGTWKDGRMTRLRVIISFHDFMSVV
ncbi:MAG: nuclear transport factor 2 family protein [Pseudomonadota bacterium]|nr:nuclear transport factor 2 family protein [Pseudomonadota bacterium]